VFAADWGWLWHELSVLYSNAGQNGTSTSPDRKQVLRRELRVLRGVVKFRNILVALQLAGLIACHAEKSTVDSCVPASAIEVRDAAVRHVGGLAPGENAEVKWRKRKWFVFIETGGDQPGSHTMVLVDRCGTVIKVVPGA
jgi:hypothetical protein